MSTRVEELATFLVPLQRLNILLPNNTVAEIIPYEPLQKIQDSPEWFMGLLSWRGLQVPVVSFEMLSRPGASFSLMSVDAASLVVCIALGAQDELPYFALVSQALPRLMRLKAEELAQGGEKRADTELMLVRLNGEPAVIPDLEYIEASIRSLGLI